MNSAALKKITRRELARRVNGGLEITLYWRPRDDSVSIEIHQTATGETIGFARSGPDRALEAFHHSFAHLAERTTRASRLNIARRA